MENLAQYTNFEPVIEKILFDPVTGKIIFLFLSLIVIWSIIKVLKRLAGNKISDTSIRYKFRKLIDLAGFIVFGVIITVVFNDKLGGLTIAFGVAGAGIAFALQEVITSMAGWVSISINRFFKPGDRVLLGGIHGDVIDVGILRSTLMECGGWVNGDLYNGRIVRVPNSKIFTDPVFNYNTDFPFLWDEIKIPIRYGSDLKMARTMIEEVADELLGGYARDAKLAWKDVVKRYLIEDARVEPLVTMVADENWVTYTLRYVVDYRSRRGTKDKLFSEILFRMDDSEGRIGIASAAFEITAFPKTDIHLDNIETVSQNKDVKEI